MLYKIHLVLEAEAWPGSFFLDSDRLRALLCVTVDLEHQTSLPIILIVVTMTWGSPLMCKHPMATNQRHV